MMRRSAGGLETREGPVGGSARVGSASYPKQALVPPTEGELRRRYETYCRRQAALLLRLVPEGGAAGLHRRASEDEGSADAFSRLTTYCRKLLPLPPFEAWCDDFLAHPARYLDVARPWQDRGEAEPVALAARSFEVRGRRWSAYLVVRALTEGWTGWLVFSTGDAEEVDSVPSDPMGCTGAIFREGSAERVVERFVDFDDSTLRAFLRSALP